MANTVDQSFIKQFESEVHLAYQQYGSKLRGTTRIKTGARGSKVGFQKVGKGSASAKTRNGDIPLMQAAHSQVEATIEDWYAGDYSDKLDEYKTNIDEKKIILDTAAGACGRKHDALIITAAETTTNIVGDGSAGDLDADPVKNAFKLLKKAIKTLNKNDVPDDGQRFVLVTADVWDLLLDEDKFSRAEYTGTDLPFLKGTEARKYMNAIWMLHTGLTVTGADDAQYGTCLVYHKTALGTAEAEEISSDIWWDGRKAAHFVNNRLSSGTCLIDAAGVVKVRVNHGLPAA